jgi:hypothetical protein
MGTIQEQRQRNLKRIMWVLVPALFLVVVVNGILDYQSRNLDLTESDEGNSDSRPKEQVEFEEKAWSFIRSFQEAEQNDNDLKMSEIERSSIDFFRQQFPAKRWVCRFVSLTTTGEYSGDNGDDDFHFIWVVSGSGFKYQLKVSRHNDDLNAYLANIKKDDTLRFSGIIAQGALTPDRMVHETDPSYEVNCLELGDIVLGDMSYLTDPMGTLRIGQLHDGGIIIRVENGHGLMIAPDDLDKIKGYANHRPAENPDLSVTGTYMDIPLLGTYTWNEAQEVLQNFSYNGHSDWRLPTQEEWDFIEANHQKDEFNMGTFYGFCYWSATDRDDIFGQRTEAFQKRVGGSSNIVEDFVHKDRWAYVRFVRDF